MNRRGFFATIAAAAAAGVALPRERPIVIASPPIDIEVWETFEVVWTPDEIARETLRVFASIPAQYRELQRAYNRDFSAQAESIALRHARRLKA